jgi:hypothetical protein
MKSHLHFNPSHFAKRGGFTMKRHVKFLFPLMALALFVFLLSSMSFAAEFQNGATGSIFQEVESENGPAGPAPNAGDGFSDGSGMEPGSIIVDGIGPAPNAGDGFPDGSGF